MDLELYVFEMTKLRRTEATNTAKKRRFSSVRDSQKWKTRELEEIATIL